MIFVNSLLFASWTKTRTAYKLLVRVKFTGNPYSYVYKRPPLKYMQTRVCRSSYTETRTVPDLYSCLCERRLTLTNACRFFSQRPWFAMLKKTTVCLHCVPKKIPLCDCLYIREIFTDFQIFTGRPTFSEQLVIKWLLNNSLYVNYVATLPCKI